MRSRQQGALVDLMAWVVGSIGRRQSCLVRILREILLSVGGRNELRRGKNDEKEKTGQNGGDRKIMRRMSRKGRRERRGRMRTTRRRWIT